MGAKQGGRHQCSARGLRRDSRIFGAQPRVRAIAALWVKVAGKTPGGEELQADSQMQRSSGKR